MNNPSPLVPQGSMLEQKNKSRARVRIAVFVVLSVHVVGLMALLMQGCRQKPTDETLAPDTNNAALTMPLSNSMVMDTNPAAINQAPTNTLNPVAIPLAGAQDYTIARGDNFTTIAKKFGVTVKAIQDANPGVDPLKIRPGQKLHIPAPTTAPTSGSPAPAPADMNGGGGGEQIYTVQSGDNLTKIAEKFHTTIKAIETLNNLTSSRIKVGDKLKIPKAPPAGTPPPPAAQVPMQTPSAAPAHSTT